MPVLCIGQNFHKIYPFDDAIAISHDIYVTDSCYYLGGTSAFGTAQLDVLLTKLDLEGNELSLVKQVTPGELNLAYGGNTQLDTNFRGNFIHGYTNHISGINSFPHLTEMDVHGNTVNYFNYTLFEADSLVFFDFGRFVVHNADSSYYGFFTYKDERVHKNGEGGSLLFKVNASGDTLWTQRFHHASTVTNKPSHLVKDLDILDNGTLLLTIGEVKQAGMAINEWARIHFITTDLDGNELGRHLYQDNTYTYGGFETLPLEDGGVIYSYFETIEDDNDLLFRAVLCRLDSDFDLVWKSPLKPNFSNGAFYTVPNKLRFVNDSVVAGVYTWSEKIMYDTTVWNSARYPMAVRVFNRHLNGDLLWARNHYYWPLTDSLNEPEYTLKDFELTPDGGFIMCGDVKNFDSLVAGVQGQFAYVLKTNCLGFLGDPEAAADYIIEDDYAITFINTSTQAGSYTWHFGPSSSSGTVETLYTDEYTDTVTHIFPGPGSYEVQLIAHGCNAAADTLAFIVEPEKVEDPTVIPNGNGYFTFFPNPVSTGGYLSLYLNALNPQDGEVYVLFHAMNGDLVQRISLGWEEGSYLIQTNMASGMYHVSLYQGDSFLQTRKLVVR